MLKVVTIGGGSSYTPELCEGLIKRYKEFPINKWILVDIPEGKEKNEIVAALSRRMIKNANLDIEVETSYNLESALSGANFVTTQLRVGMQKARFIDESTCFKYGMLGQETNGIGGLFKGIRTIPVILDIVEKVKKYCNGAWIINFTNPSGMVSQAVNNYGNYEKFIGVCNIPIHTRMAVSKMINKNYLDINMDAAGLNHMVFFNNFYYKNKNITKKILKLAVADGGELTVKNISNLSWNPSLIKGINALPCSYHKYYYKRGTMLSRGLKDYKNNVIRSQVVMNIEKKLFEHYKNINLKTKPKELSERGGAYYSDVACGVMKAIYADTNEEFVVNVVNNGKISNLDDDWTVEVTCRLNKNGAEKVSRKISIHEDVLPLVNQIKQFEKTAINGIINKNKSKILVAAITNPLSEDDIKVEKLVNELFKLHSKYIKGFK